MFELKTKQVNNSIFLIKFQNQASSKWIYILMNFKWNSPEIEVFTYLISIKDINNKKHVHHGTCHVLK